jgi:hypothetical protein
MSDDDDHETHDEYEDRKAEHEKQTCPDCAGIGQVPKRGRGCKHVLDDGRCLLCGIDLEYTPE